jgi:hypothetical protein
MATPQADVKDLPEAELVEKINQSSGSESVVSTFLKTDERVLARVTDGIYRQPGSALRELISNAYDADATRVVIGTDAPRFQRISIEDDGHGMTPEALAYVLYHIGGSAKRKEDGGKLGVTNTHDPLLSPNGRRLIGKIGIGLFSVSQLTHSFQIITKVAGDPFRTVATVVLRQYSEDEHVISEGQKKFESGLVNVWREKAADEASHGTSIILTNIRPQARDTLRSREIWSAIEQNEKISDEEEKQAIDPPAFHIGRVDANSGELLKKTDGQQDSLPWGRADPADIAFRKLVQAVWDQVEEANPNPQLERIFDYYLRMVWQLSLAVPLPYVDGHLFDLFIEGARVFELSNEPKGSSEEAVLGEKSIRAGFQLTDSENPTDRFEVFIDNLQLFRPIKFRGLPTTQHPLKHPLIFVGKCRETFPGKPIELSGGPLSFEAYLFWTPKVAPTEHQGSLIRIHDSSGTLFDSTFMRYQVSEQTRLRQITCEIFVTQGLDSALNIDRESFNYAHPHSVFITKWLHGALRQLASTQKKLASEVRKQERTETKIQVVKKVRRIASREWSKQSDDDASVPPQIELSDAKQKKSDSDTYRFSRSTITGNPPVPKTTKARARQEILEEKVKAIAQVLASYGLLDKIAQSKQEHLLRAIYRILDAEEE